MQNDSPDKWEASAYTSVWVRRGEISRTIRAESWKHKESGWKKGGTFEKLCRLERFISSDSAWSGTGGRVWHFVLRSITRQPVCCEVHQTRLLLTLYNFITNDEKEREALARGWVGVCVGWIRRCIIVEERKNGVTPWASPLRDGSKFLTADGPSTIQAEEKTERVH